MCSYFGGSLEESKSAYREAIIWYDALPDKTICRNCLGMFLKPGMLRSIAEEYMDPHSTKPLHVHWVLFQELVVAAALLLTERRLEGQHAIVGSDGKQALTNVKLPPAVCANLRVSQFRQAVKEDLFWEVLQNHFFGRARWTKLLSHRLNPTQLKLLTEVEKCQKLYMYDSDTAFRADEEEKQCMLKWKKASAAAQPPKVAPLTASQTCLVDHFKSHLPRGTVFSIPALEDGDEDLEAVSTPDSIVLVLQAAPPPCFAIADISDDACKLYEVILKKPGDRTYAKTATRTRPTASMISVRQLKVIGTSEDGHVTVEPIHHDSELLDLLPWTTRSGFQHVFTKLALWRTARNSTSITSRLAIEDQLPSAHLAALHDDEPLLALVPMDVHQNVLAICAEMSEAYQNEIPTFGNDKLNQMSTVSLNALIDKNIMVRQRSIFGDEVLVFNWDKVQWNAQRVLCEPIFLGCVAQDVPDPRQMSKVSLMMALLQMGWTADRDAVTLTSESARGVYIRNLFRSKSYFLALLDSPRILHEKRFPGIPHDKPIGFYECLLNLDETALRSMRNDANYPRYKNQHFLSILKGHGVDFDLAVLMNGEVENVDNPVAMELAPLMPALMQPRAANKPIVSRGGMFRINFDNFSHSSGTLRAFIRCGNDDHNQQVTDCQRYTDVKIYDSIRDCCAFLVAWAKDGHCTADRQAHKYFFPTAAQQKVAKALLD